MIRTCTCIYVRDLPWCGWQRRVCCGLGAAWQCLYSCCWQQRPELSCPHSLPGRYPPRTLATSWLWRCSSCEPPCVEESLLSTEIEKLIAYSRFHLIRVPGFVTLSQHCNNLVIPVHAYMYMYVCVCTRTCFYTGTFSQYAIWLSLSVWISTIAFVLSGRAGYTYMYMHTCMCVHVCVFKLAWADFFCAKSS